MTESSVACSWISVTASRMFSTEFSGNARSSSSTRRLDSSCSPANARGEREEEERDEREDREVGDHRRQVRAAVGQKLADDGVHGGGSLRSCVRFAARGSGSGSRRPRRDLLADRVGRARRRDGGARLDVRRRGERARSRRRRSVFSRTRPGREARPSQVQIAFLEGSVFVVRDDERIVAAVTGREPTSGLVFYDLKTCLRLAGEQPARKRQPRGRSAARRRRRTSRRPTMAKGRVAAAVVRSAPSRRRGALVPAGGQDQGARRGLLRRRVDGDVRARLRGGRAPLPDRPSDPVAGPFVNDAELATLIREHAYLEGTSCSARGARATTSTSTASRPAPTCSAPSASGSGRGCGGHAGRGPHRRPGARRHRARGRGFLSSGLPFLIVRKEAKAYGTERRLEGVFSPGEEVCLVEDVVTSGGAAADAIDVLREAGLECRVAVCVVDREEEAPTRLPARRSGSTPSFAPATCSSPEIGSGRNGPQNARKPAWLLAIRGLC